MLSFPYRALVVDDEPTVAESHQALLTNMGIKSDAETDPRKVLDRLKKNPDIRLMLLDIQMKSMTGIELLRELRTKAPHVRVIMATVLNDIQHAVEATKLGAYNYLLKPLNEDRLAKVVGAAQASLEHPLSDNPAFASYITGDKQFLEIFRRLERFAVHDAPILVNGETGTGKDLVAEIIHNLSPRCDEPFMAVNIAALSHQLFEAELFGYAKGAFTGALRDHKGYFEACGKGSLFLDEIGELSMDLQGKLLRVLQNKTFMRIGETSPRTCEAQFIFATNRDLKAEVNKGNFREDLYYRINQFGIMLPPLRQRKGDIALLSEFFRRKYCSQYGKRMEALSKECLTLLESYTFPGNVRELENAINAAVLLEDESTVQPTSLPDNIREEVMRIAGCTTEEIAMVDDMLDALADHGGNQTKAAQDLGISRQTLNQRIKKFKDMGLISDTH